MESTRNDVTRESTGFLIGGKYRLVERIGDGGMGSIWRAVHQGLEREVAVKLVDLEGSNTDERSERFLREARICAAVRHRYVVDIFDVDVTPGGHPYMVMELLRGETLAQRMSREPTLSVAEMVGILAQCLSGLDAVHRAGIVHRDLKPENIFLTADGEGGLVPKIVDFGISRAEAASIDSNAKRLTREGTVLGTPWYMAPEQARAKTAVGPQADLYSLGVIAYEALTGQLPFDSASLTDLLLMIVTEDAAPVLRWRPDLPPALSSVVERAMQRDLGLRHPSAADLRRELLASIDELDPTARTMLIPLETEDEVAPLVDEEDPFGRSSGIVRAITSDVAPRPALPPPPRQRSAPPHAETHDSMDGLELPADAAPAPRVAPSPSRRSLFVLLALGLAASIGATLWLLGSSRSPTAPPALAGFEGEDAPAGPADLPEPIAADEEGAPLPADGTEVTSEQADTISDPASAETAPAEVADDDGSSTVGGDRPRRRSRSSRARSRSSRRRAPAAFRDLDF